MLSSASDIHIMGLGESKLAVTRMLEKVINRLWKTKYFPAGLFLGFIDCNHQDLLVLCVIKSVLKLQIQRKESLQRRIKIDLALDPSFFLVSNMKINPEAIRVHKGFSPCIFGVNECFFMCEILSKSIVYKFIAGNGGRSLVFVAWTGIHVFLLVRGFQWILG